MKNAVGFLIAADLSRVTLSKDAEGLWSAVGGPLKNGEKPGVAMYRIFLEATGVEVLRWTFLGRMKSLDQSQQDFYVAKGDRRLLDSPEEPVQWLPVPDLTKQEICPVTTWLIYYARTKFMSLSPRKTGVFTSG